MNKKITLKEWKEMGVEIKEIRKKMMDLHILLVKNFSKNIYASQLEKIKKSFDELRCQLDDAVCSEFPHTDDKEVLTIFYGKNEKE